jgi:hypothetical protein
MFQFRQVLVRLRAGDTAREIASSGLLGRDKLTELTRLAQAQGWLDPGCELPDDETIATALTPRKRASSSNGVGMGISCDRSSAVPLGTVGG